MVTINLHTPSGTAVAVAGAIAGATGGTSLLASGVVGDLAAGTTSGIVGGIVTRGLDPNTSADDVLSASEISEDAVGGFVGGGVGHIAADSVHIPEDPSFRSNGRNGRVNNQAYRQGLRDLRARNTGAFVNQGVRSGVSSSLSTHTSNGLFDWFSSWFIQPPPPPPPPPGSGTGRIVGCQDMQGNPCQ
jgi:hypothetical protein